MQLIRMAGHSALPLYDDIDIYFKEEYTETHYGTAVLMTA